MKKVLLATTILALSAPLALAEVTVSGNGRMGVVYDGAKADNKMSFSSRFRVVFTASSETDGGLSFGGTIRADNAVAGAAGTAGSVFISGAFGKISMGDTDGAAENATGDLVEIGYTGLGTLNEFTYLTSTANGPVALYEYTTGGLTVMLSHTNPGVASKVASVGLSYSANGFTVAGGVERMNSTPGVAAIPAVPGLCAVDTGVSNDNVVGTGGDGLCDADQVQLSGSPAIPAIPGVGTLTHYTLAASYTMDGITVKAAYGNLDQKGVAGSLDQYGLSVAYAMDALTVSAFGRKDFADDQHVGIGAAYDLGGGASLVGGLVNTNFDAPAVKSRTQADLGVKFTF